MAQTFEDLQAEYDSRVPDDDDLDSGDGVIDDDYGDWDDDWDDWDEDEEFYDPTA